MRSLAAVLLIGALAWFGSADRALGEDWLVSPQCAAKAGLQAYWQVTLPLLPTESVDEISGQDRQVYVTTTGGAIMAVAADTGIVRWMHKLVEPGSKIFPPQNIGEDPQTGFVLVTSVTSFYIMDQLDGRILIEVPLRLPPSGPAATDGVRIFVGGNNGWLHSIPLNDGYIERRSQANLYDRAITWPYQNAAFGSLKQHYAFGIPKGVWGLDWSVRFDEIVPSPPAILEDRFYLTVGEQIYCIGTFDKADIWSRPVGGPVVGTVAASKDGVFVASSDASLRSFNSDTGRLQWRFRAGSPCTAAPVLAGDTVYLATEAGLFAVDVAEGTARWHVDGGLALLSRDNKFAYVMTGCEIQTIENATGEVTRRMPGLGNYLTTTTRGNKGVYFATQDGRLACLMPEDVPYLRSKNVKKELRRPSEQDAELAAELKKLTSPPQEPLEEPNPLESEASRRARAEAAGGANP